MTRFPMEAGPVEIVNDAGTVVGRGFAVNGPEGRQSQWWVLDEGYRPPPLDTSSWRRPASAEELGVDFANWQTKYARGAAPADSYYCVATVIATQTKPDPGGPVPTAPPDETEEEQINYGVVKLMAPSLIGYVMVPKDQSAEREKTEHWVLYGDRGAAPMRIEGTTEEIETKREVLLRIGAEWKEGATYGVCTCKYSPQSF